MYKGRCIGRLVNFLTDIIGVRDAYNVTFWGGYNAINLNCNDLTSKNIIAIYKWCVIDGMADVPHFIFFNDYEYWNAESEKKIKQTVHDEQVRLGVSELKEN